MRIATILLILPFFMACSSSTDEDVKNAVAKVNDKRMAEAEWTATIVDRNK